MADTINMKKHFYVNNTHSEKNTLLPECYHNQIVQGDSKQVLTQLPDNCIDLIFTSPPYNFDMDYENTDDNKSGEIYFKELFSVLSECVRVLKYGGRLIVNIQPLFSEYVPTHHIISQYLMRSDMIWRGEILWEKHNYNCNYTAWGSWKSPSSPYLKYTWEYIEIFSKGSVIKAGDRENADINGEQFKEWVNAKWAIVPEQHMDKWDHPAMFPEELAYRILLLFSFKHDIILDPFNGVGTTCVVAQKTERTYLGIDISEKYCETARQRLEYRLL